MMRKLSEKQEAFLAAYLSNGRNASAAYRAAYKAEGMSEASVNKEAARLLKNPRIAPRLLELREKSAERLQVTSDDITLSACRAMMANLKRTLDANGKPLPMHQWPDDLMLAVDGYEHTKETDPQGYTTEKVKVKLTSRATARDQLAKHVGYYAEDNKQKGAGLLAALNDLPDDVRGRMIEKLRGITGRTGPVDGVAISADGSPGRTTH